MLVNIQRTGSVEVPLPKYQTEGSAGFDLHAAIESQVMIWPAILKPHDSDMVVTRVNNWKLIPAGFSIEIPPGCEGQIRPRSGLALKHGISIVNSPGTIDSDYRGPIGVIIINHGSEVFIINPLDRIAQMVISPVLQAHFVMVESLTDTERGDGGFGSTGFQGAIGNQGFVKYGEKSQL
jgi:dUTP pyrophosphatase